MVSLVSALLSFYLCSLLAFSFVTHPINYCFLLLCSALSVSCCVFVVFGFSWYVVLFCLVYVGGVYILFVFVSLHSPNPTHSLGCRLDFLAICFLAFFVILLGAGFKYSDTFMESSHYLCSSFEGFSYCFFCLILMVGFVVVSIVSGDKDSFSR